MGIIIDLIIIGIMILFIYMGYRKGLIKVAISFLSVIIAVLIALILYKPVANQIMVSTELDEKISDSIYKQIENIDFENMNDEDKNSGIMQVAGRYIQDAVKQSTQSAARYIADSLTVTIVEGLTFIGLIIVLRILLLALNLLANVVGNIPIIKQFNKSGGTIYGIVEGFLIVNVILAIMYILNPIYANGDIAKNIEKSYLGKAIYENNFIVNTIVIK